MTRLIQPIPRLKSSFIQTQLLKHQLNEKISGFDTYLIKKFPSFNQYLSWLEQNFDSYLHLVIQKQTPGNFPFVPQEEFWLARNQTFLGRSTFRYHLTPKLKRLGGHVGLYINPLYRNQGFGTKLLALTIQQAFAKNLRPLMLTTGKSNQTSQTIITKNGGKLHHTHHNLLYYSIN